MTAARKLLLSLTGPVLALLHFTFVYVLAALACARRFADAEWAGVGIVPATGGLATLVTLAAIVAVPWMQLRRRGAVREPLLDWLTVAFAGAGAATVLFVALPLALVPACR